MALSVNSLGDHLAIVIIFIPLSVLMQRVWTRLERYQNAVLGTDGIDQCDLVRGQLHGDLCFEYSNILLMTTLLP